MAKRNNENIEDKDIKSQSAEKEIKEDNDTMNKEHKTDHHNKKKSSKKSKSSKEKELQEKIDELNDKYLRLFSEFDNFRKRTAREKLDLVNSASAKLIEELLPVLDDFERAIESNKQIEGCDVVKEGIEHVYNKFYSTLEKQGLKPMDSKEKEFDTDLHEAITRIPAPSDDLKGKVVDVVQKGYLLNDKVVRYAKVVIGQ
jgi:molecular chaperone GrpE